jgi:hypothetical protein
MSDALDRLRKRQRPTVPIRDTSLVSGGQDTSISGSPGMETSEHEKTAGKGILETETETSPDISTSRYPENSDNSGLLGSHERKPSSKTVNRQSTSPDTSTPRYPDTKKLEAITQPLTTKQSTLRLEANLSDRLQSLCREHNLCREVLLEAMFEHCEANQDVLKQVLVSAQEKNEHRQQIANLKRAQSMMKRFGQMGS